MADSVNPAVKRGPARILLGSLPDAASLEGEPERLTAASLSRSES